MSNRVMNVAPNAKQWKLLKSRAKRKSFIGGRGSGKSVGLGMKMGLIFNAMPRSTWAIAGLTYVQIDSVLIQSIREALELLGYHEYDPQVSPWGVYVIGKIPPKKWGEPYKKPGRKAYQYTITFINGCTFRLISQDLKHTNRGLSIDGILVDESATMDYSFIQEVLLPAFRGKENVSVSYRNHPWRYGFFNFSSASWTVEGNWIYETEVKYLDMLDRRAKMDETELLANPPEYLFLESTYRDNQDNLPDDYGPRLHDLMDPWKYDVEVENRRVLKLPNAYYHTLTTNGKHGYKQSYTYNTSGSAGLLVYQSNDYLVDKPLEVSLDFNTDICWLLVCQEIGKELRFINSEFKKPLDKKIHHENLVKKLAEWLNETYSNHENKDVFVYGDPGGNSTSATTSADNRPFFDQFDKVLTSLGWTVFRRELTSYPSHKDKYALVNLMLEESSERLPKLRFNINTNKALLIALQNTLVKVDKSFKKDKSSEGKARLREYATDSTDAFDYILWAKYRRFLPNSTWLNTGIITARR